MIAVPSGLAGAVLAVLAATLLAVQALCIRVGTDDGGSVEALGVVLAVNLLLYIPGAMAFKPTATLSPVAIGAFALAGLVGAVIGRGAYYAAIGLIGASRTEPIKASQPLHASVIAVLVLGETLTAGALVGIVCIIVGVAVVSVRSTDSADGDTRLSGLALAFGAALAYGIEPTIASIGLDAGTPLLVGLAVKTAVATGLTFAVLARRGSLTTGFTAPGRRWYVAAGVANTLFQVAYYGALSVGSVVSVVPVIQTSPLFVAALAALILPRRERVTPVLVGASCLVVGGAILVTLSG
jgi:drug/metabolite transporter (DMT)-like permease